MSNPEQQSVASNPRGTEERSIEEGEIVETQSGEESDAGNEGEVSGIREIVAALPAMSIRESYVKDNDDNNDDDQENKAAAAAAAALIVAAAAEAEAAAKGKGEKAKGKEVAGSNGGKRTMGERKRWRQVVKSSTGAATSGTGEAKPKRKAPELRNPPAGEPTCPICNRKFVSWKAAFGHQRAHKGREHRGLFPPPRFTPPPCPQRQPDSAADAGTSGASGSGGGGRLSFDLNAPPVEESGGGGSGNVAKFDLNKTPPKENSDEEEA